MKNKDISTLGGRINLIIKNANIKQSEFAKSLGINVTSVNKYVNNVRVPRASILVLICEKYNVNPTWLKYGIDNIYVDSDVGNYKVLVSKFQCLNEDFQSLIIIIMDFLIKIQNKIKP